MTLEALFLFLAGSLQFYGAWSMDFAWHGRETDGRVGLPFPNRMVHVSARSWWAQAWGAMIMGVLLLILLFVPAGTPVGFGGAGIAILGLVLVWYSWYKGRGILGGGYAATWNAAFFLGVFGGSLVIILGV